MVATANGQGRERYKKLGSLCHLWAWVTASLGLLYHQTSCWCLQYSQALFWGPQINYSYVLLLSQDPCRACTSVLLSVVWYSTLSPRSCCRNYQSWSDTGTPKGSQVQGTVVTHFPYLGPLVIPERVGGPECGLPRLFEVKIGFDADFNCVIKEAIYGSLIDLSLLIFVTRHPLGLHDKLLFW